MARVSAYPMVSVPGALAAILEQVRRLPSEEVSLLDARGRVLAEDVHAGEDLPGLARSAVDGYAVIAGDQADSREILGDVTAGRLAEVQVRPGTAVRIMTGGILPPGANAVVMVEDADEAGEQVVVHRAAQPGANVHPPGIDVARGERVVPAGRRVGPAEVGLLAAVGKTRLAVFQRPKVAILATGDEIVEPDVVPPPGAVRDSNRYALLAAVEESGGTVPWHRHGRDDESLLAALAHEGLAAADVLLTSGGVSMGTRDLIKPILEDLGTIHFGRVAFKPGKPLTFATTSQGKLIFGLPGFPVSSLVTFEVFVRPALLAMQGLPDVTRPQVEVTVEHELRPDPVRLEYQRARVRWDKGRFFARTTGLQVSSRLLSMAGANALLEIEPGASVLPEGAVVRAHLLTDL